MKKKARLDRKKLPVEMTKLEGLNRGIDVANMYEVINSIFWNLANIHTVKDLQETLRIFRGKPFGFWRKRPAEHHGNK